MTTAVATQFLSHAEYAKDCAEAARKRRPLRQFVQVDYSGAPVCAVIVDAWDSDDRPMWKVDLLAPLAGRISLPAHKVRKCSGVDGKCHCHCN